MTAEDFRLSANIVSAEFAKIDKRNRSITALSNANAAKKKIAGGVWLPCCRMGIPCTSRIVACIERNDAHIGKELIIRCAETKLCLHST